MKYMNLVAVLGVVFFVGCATTKAPSSQQRIENVGRTFEETDKQIVQAEKELQSFDKSIAKLRRSASGDEKMRTKSGFDSAMARLSSGIEQTRLDLQELKTTNARARNTYKQQLGDAASEIQQSSNDNQAE